MDGAISKSFGGARFGAAIKDSDGRLLVAFFEKFQGCETPYLAKLLGCRSTLDYLLSHCPRLVFIEVDSKMVYRALTIESEDCSEYD